MKTEKIDLAKANVPPEKIDNLLIPINIDIAEFKGVKSFMDYNRDSFKMYLTLPKKVRKSSKTTKIFLILKAAPKTTPSYIR